MAKKPTSRPAHASKPRRGRPPKPGGRIPQVEVQRAYRARLAAAGKVVRIVDTGAIVDARLAAQSIPDFDPAKDGVFERQMVESMRDQLRSALVRLELREEEVRDLRDRNAHLELELQRQGRQLTNALKDNIVLKQQAKRKKKY
jgi:hypothetical protein